jgi:hypothetical protein
MTAAARKIAAAPGADQAAAKIRSAMAYAREDFKNKVEEHLSGALLEFYKARLAQKNGQIRWVDHWLSEVRRLLELSLVAALLHPIRGFRDRRKALDEAIGEIKAVDAGYRRTAENVIKRDYAVVKLKRRLDDDDATAFWEMVETATAPALAGSGWER